MQVSHGVSAVFDDPNLVSVAGLVPVMSLADRCDLAALAGQRLTLSGDGAANVHLKVPALIGGMAAGADSIDDMDLLRHGGMDRLFAGVRAPSTLGTFLRSFTFGHVRQLDGIASRFWATWPRTPRCWPVRSRWPSSISMTRCARRMGMPSRPPGMATRGWTG